MPQPSNFIGVVTRSQAEYQEEESSTTRIMASNFPVKMPEYSGSTNPKQFVQMFDSFCALSGVQDAQKSMAFSLTLEDSAKDWLYSLPIETAGSWDVAVDISSMVRDQAGSPDGILHYHL